jgi:glyoxylase-like metal-dependent hydrolase (beta-lactamase superfamily II)
VNFIGEWSKVHPRILRAVGSPVDVNCVLVLGSERALLVDTGSCLADGQALQKAASQVAGECELLVVNTHAHYDHCFGNAAYAPETIWGSVGCADDLAASGETQREIAVAEWTASDPLFAAALGAAPIVPPGNVVRESLTLDLGDCRAQLIHPGRAHTNHDLAVWIPEFGALLAGDLVEESGAPALEDAYPLSWPTSLARLLRFQPEVVVPGHGCPVGLDFAKNQLRELQELADWCRAALAGALPASWGPNVQRTFPEQSQRLALARTRRELTNDP